MPQAVIQTRDSRASATFHFGNNQTPKTLGRFLSELEEVYTGIVFLEQVPSMLQERVPLDFFIYSMERTPYHTYEKPTIRELHINSPGWMTIIADLNPLKAVVDLVKLYQKSKNDASKIKIEEAKFILAAEEHYYKIAEHQIELMKKAGFSEDEIQERVRQILGNGVPFMRSLEGVRVTSVVLNDGKEEPPRRRILENQ